MEALISHSFALVKLLAKFPAITALMVAIAGFSPSLVVKAQNSGPPITIQWQSGKILLSWKSGTLQERTNLSTDTWRVVTNASNPYLTAPTGHEHYYRVLIALVPGNLQWKKWNFVCDDGHNNSFTLERDGSPVAGSGNCNSCGPALPGISGSCWANPVLLSVPNGNLFFNQSQDDQVYGRTFLYVNQGISFSVFVNGDAFSLWLNDVRLDTPNNAAIFNLVPGWNKVEFTSYNQNQGTEVTINIPMNNVLSLDSNGPGN